MRGEGMKRDRTSKCDKTLQGGERGKKAEKYILKLNNDTKYKGQNIKSA